MPTSWVLRPRLTAGAVAALAVLLAVAASDVIAQQGPPVAVFARVSSSRNTPQLHVVRPVLEVVALAGQRGSNILIALPGLDVVGRLQHFETQANGFFTAGPVLRLAAGGAPTEGEVSLTVVDGTLAGRVVVGNQLFRITRLGTSEFYEIEEVDTTTLPPDGDPIAVPEGELAVSQPVGDFVEAGDSNALVDLLIAYTPAARNALGGTSQIQAEATAAVNNANLALANTGTVHRYRLVYLGEVNYVESGSSSTDLSRLRSVTDGFMDSIHGLRDFHQADVVSLLTQASDACGVGYLMGPSSVNNSFNTSAFNVTIALGCANANLSLPHEIGHNSGLHHDRANAGSTPAFSFAYGYTVPGLARTVMAYACASGGSCPRRAVFSSPNVAFPGTSTAAGTATEDNGTATGLTAPVVANFRDSTCSFSLGTNSISLGLAGGTGAVAVTTSSGCAWNSVSSDTTVVTVTGGSSSTGSASASYSVSASAGARSATLTIAGMSVSVTQAPEAPGAFGKSSPANGATGQVTGPTLSWTASTGATSYEYCIDTTNNDACNASWVSVGSATSAALSGLGNVTPYYWHVRASNAGGTTYAQASATAFWRFTTRPQPRPVLDLNGDGAGDVFTYNAATGDWVRQTSQAGGGFAATPGSWAAGWSVVSAKFNGDALTDFFLFNPTTGAWSKMLNDGAGFTTQASGEWWPGWQPFVMNLDADGVSDLFLHDPGNGQWFKCVSTPAGFTYTQGGWNPGWEIHPMTLNADAFGDMFLINRTTGRWFWVLGSAGPSFTYPVSDAWFPAWALYPGDYNGDGLTDLLLHDPPTGTFFVAMNALSQFTYQQGGWSLGLTPMVGDLNSDGAEDVFLHDPLTGRWFEMISNGAGGFANAGGQTWSLGWNIHLTDLNADGRTDLVLYHPATGVWYQARNFSLGTFTYTTGTWLPNLAVIRAPVFLTPSL